MPLADKQAELCRSLFPQSVIVKRPVNFGCGRNIIDARIQLFTNMKYDYVFMFEDDMVPSDTYMALTTRLMEWAESHYTDVGVVQSWNITHLPVEEKRRILSEVHATYTNWWGYLMKRELWDAIFPDVLEYQELFLGGSYSGRPHRSIIEWFRMKQRTVLPPNLDTTFPVDDKTRETAKSYFGTPPTGQDAVTMIMAEIRGWKRLATSVNRGEYIGRQGIHMNPRRFIQDGFTAMSNDVFEEDGDLSEFHPRSGELVETQNIEEAQELEGIRRIEG
jgi:hypothetical protein